MARTLTLRTLCAFLCTLALSACSGAGGNGLPGNTVGLQCNPGTQVQLARPAPGQFGVPGSIGQVEIVANGNNNTLYNTYSQWNLVLQDNFGDPPITTGPLSLVADPGAPHPFASDFYYSGNIGTTLPSGANWTVTMEQQPFGMCVPAPVGSFQT